MSFLFNKYYTAQPTRNSLGRPRRTWKNDIRIEYAMGTAGSSPG